MTPKQEAEFKARIDVLRADIFKALQVTYPDISMETSKGTAVRWGEEATVFRIHSGQERYERATSKIQFHSLVNGDLEVEVTTRPLTKGYMRGFSWNSKGKPIPVPKVVALIGKQLERAKADAAIREQQMHERRAREAVETGARDLFADLNAKYPNNGLFRHFEDGQAELTIRTKDAAIVAEVFRRLEGLMAPK